MSKSLAIKKFKVKKYFVIDNKSNVIQYNLTIHL